MVENPASKFIYELYYFNKLGIRDRLYHFYVDDDKLLYLYQHAVAFIFPSQYEGFGLPVLEAFGCGCPVLVSNTSSLPEVGGEAVIYFEPKKISSLIRALNIILDKKETREGLIAKGYCQLKKFSWQKTATITKEIYSRILAERKGGGLMKTGPH
jgi:glycosyltransferase involved in cell wall biosynthesis